MKDDEIKSLIEETYLMFNLNTILFLDDVDNKIERYAKINLDYVQWIENKISSCKNVENWLKMKKDVVERLNFLLDIVENTPKIYVDINNYTRLIYNIKTSIKYFEHLRIKKIKSEDV